MKKLLKRRVREAGLTLLELVVVLAILVALTTAVAAKLDFFQVRANKGIAASNMVDVGRFVQTFYISNNHLPNGWDSLTDGTALWGTAADPTLASLDRELFTGSAPKLTAGTLNDHQVESLTRLGITTLFNVSTTSDALPADRFTEPVTLDDTTIVALVNGGNDEQDAILEALYKGQGIPTDIGPGDGDRRIVVFGLGSRNEMVGPRGLLMEAPAYPNIADHNLRYDRMLVAFEVRDGKRARLLGVLGGDGDTLSSELADYYDPQY